MTKVIYVRGFNDYGSIVIKGIPRKMDFLDGESGDCYTIHEALKRAYDQGKDWEELQFEEIEDNDIFSDNYTL